MQSQKWLVPERRKQSWSLRSVAALLQEVLKWGSDRGEYLAKMPMQLPV